jgi:hypothetical protein
MKGDYHGWADKYINLVNNIIIRPYNAIVQQEVKKMKPVYLTLIMYIWGAFVFTHPLSACVEVISEEIQVDSDMTFECELHFTGNGFLFVQDGVTVKIAKPVIAERRQIFIGPGQVQLSGTNAPAAFPEWFGADPGGETDSSLSFQKAADSLVSGGTLLGDPAAVYRLQDHVYIKNNDTILDMQHALIKGSAIRQIRCYGDLGGHEPGDWSAALKGCIVRNVRIGDSIDSQNQFSGVILRWCIGCGVENIIKKGETGSSFRMNVCRDCFFRNIENYGSHPTKGRIGFLLHMTWDTVVENCHAKDGPFLYAFQVKGGENATIINSSATNILPASGDPDAVVPEFAFRDRGDAPWRSSETADGDLIYPFPDKSWNEPDIRRASHNTQFIHLSVTNAPHVVAYIAQEAIGTRLYDVTAQNVELGLKIKRAIDGQESDFSIEKFLFKDTVAGAVVLSSNDITPLSTVHLRAGEIISENAGITLKSAQDVCFADIERNGIELGFNDLMEENTSGTVITPCRWDLDCDNDVDGSNLAAYLTTSLEDLESFVSLFGINDCMDLIN